MDKKTVNALTKKFNAMCKAFAEENGLTFEKPGAAGHCLNRIGFGAEFIAPMTEDNERTMFLFSLGAYNLKRNAADVDLRISDKVTARAIGYGKTESEIKLRTSGGRIITLSLIKWITMVKEQFPKSILDMAEHRAAAKSAKAAM